ncbi:FadD7 family fatty acid--CoA ligase [Streptomyces nodosus]|uniref:FadD7 family fatty acid--CoA ligase n=1 Tax=Streptomyces nodosus TaxID=40318 RepID=UPI00380C24D6
MTASTARSTDLAPWSAPAVPGLAGLLDRHARIRPAAPALIVGEDRVPVSYGALAALAEDVAAWLSCTGLRAGDAVGLVSADTVEFVAALLGAARAGLVTAPLDPALPGPQLSARLAAIGAQAVLTGDPSVAGAPPEVRIPAWPVRAEVSRAGAAALRLPSGARAVRRSRGAAEELTGNDALVLFTAGTTDAAKAVPLTHANVAGSVVRICATYRLAPADATVAVMPFFHGHGLFAGLLSPLATGGTVLLPARGRFSAHTFWDDVRAADATWFTAVPTILAILLERAAREYPGGQPRLRFVRTSSAPLNAVTARTFERTFGAPLLSAYGMTETAHQAAGELLPQDGMLKCGTVGPATGVDLRIIGADGHERPRGSTGEVWVHGPTVTRGYLGDAAGTARSFSDGWFHTGDLGSLDADGYLTLTGRIKTLINRGGEKISPEHVEDVLAGCPGVVEAAVFAVADTTYGSRVGAAVVVRDGDAVGPEQILGHCRDRLAPFEVPERLDVVSTLPHTAKGGLDRTAVKARYVL